MNSNDFEFHAKKQREIVEEKISLLQKNSLFDEDYYNKLRQQTEKMIEMDRRMMTHFDKKEVITW